MGQLKSKQKAKAKAQIDAFEGPIRRMESVYMMRMLSLDDNPDASVASPASGSARRVSWIHTLERIDDSQEEVLRVEQLPEDMIETILLYVQPAASVTLCGQTCRRMRTILRESSKVWRHLVLREFGPTPKLTDPDKVHWREVHAYLCEKRAYAELAAATSSASGFAPLAATVVFADDGLSSSEFPPENALTVGRGCWCTGSGVGMNVDLVVDLKRLALVHRFVVTNADDTYTAPVKDVLIFTSLTPPDLDAARSYDDGATARLQAIAGLSRDPLLNDQGHMVCLGTARYGPPGHADYGGDKLYCGRSTDVAGTDGRCGPSAGPQCAACERLTASVMLNDEGAAVRFGPVAEESIDSNRRDDPDYDSDDYDSDDPRPSHARQPLPSYRWQCGRTSHPSQLARPSTYPAIPCGGSYHGHPHQCSACARFQLDVLRTVRRRRASSPCDTPESGTDAQPVTRLSFPPVPACLGMQLYCEVEPRICRYVHFKLLGAYHLEGLGSTNIDVQDLHTVGVMLPELSAMLGVGIPTAAPPTCAYNRQHAIRGT